MRPRDIIVVVADSLRWDSVFGGDGPRLPFLAPRSTSFREARAAGCWTLPATASLFTGLMPHEHGADTQSRGLSTRLPTLAERLRDAGWATAQVTANVATTEIFGLGRGFDEVVRIWTEVPTASWTVDEILVIMGKPRLRKRLFSTDFIRGKLAEDVSSSKVWVQDMVGDILARARGILAANERRGKSSFLFLNLMETHFPYHIAPRFDTVGRGLDRLREVVALVDLVQQRWLTTDRPTIAPLILERLKGRQRLSWERLAPTIDAFAEEMHARDALFVFLSDHGDCFGEQGCHYHFNNVADGGNRVPLFWLPPGQRQGDIVGAPVSARDLYPWLLQTAGLEGWSPAREPERSLPVMQSTWYDNQGRTLARHKDNQICLLEGGTRWLRRRGAWYAAPPSDERGEAPFVRLPPDVDPVEDLALPAERRTLLRRVVTDFEAYSTRVAA
jgi:hypothetical protein